MSDGMFSHVAAQGEPAIKVPMFTLSNNIRQTDLL